MVTFKKNIGMKTCQFKMTKRLFKLIIKCKPQIASGLKILVIIWYNYYHVNDARCHRTE